MSTKSLIFLIFLLVNVSYELGGYCSDKKIVENEGIDGYSLVVEEISDYFLQTDYRKAFYNSASCATLTTDDDTSLCCYMKVRYKLDKAKSHYTSRGCVEVSQNSLANSDSFGDMRRSYEDGIKNHYADDPASTVSDVDVDIDCNSNFIKFTALAFLVLLL